MCGHTLIEVVAPLAVGRIHPHCAPGFGVLEGNQPHVRNRQFERVVQVHGNRIVAARRHVERLAVRFGVGLKVRDEEDDAALLVNAVQCIECVGNLGAAPLGLEGQQLAHNAQYVAAATPGRNVQLDLVGEDNQPHAVVVACGGKGEHGSQFGSQFALQARRRAKIARGRRVHHEHDRQLARLDVALDIGLVHARGHIPVNRAHVVAGLVGAHLVELHARALEDRVIVTRKLVGDQMACAQLNLADARHEFGGNACGRGVTGRRQDNGRRPQLLQPCAHHQGTVVKSRMRRTMSSLETSSASAS